MGRNILGTEVKFALSDIRSIDIFVLGEVFSPGLYTVSSLATLTNAIISSGGVKRSGSLRNIQLKRNGDLIQELDLYDLLLKGDTSKDSKLLPGDVVFIPPITKTVAVYGEVNRPAIYELDETGQNDPIWMGESYDYYLQAADIDSWKTLKLSLPVPLFSGMRYLAAVRGWAHPLDTSLISLFPTSAPFFNTATRSE